MSQRALGLVTATVTVVALVGVAWMFSSPTPDRPVRPPPALREPARAAPPPSSAAPPKDRRPEASEASDQARFDELTAARDQYRKQVRFCTHPDQRYEARLVLETVDQVIADRDAAMYVATLAMLQDLYIPQAIACQARPPDRRPPTP